MDDKSIIHFGITMSLRTRGYKLTRENYAIISNKSKNIALTLCDAENIF
jgi:hypothetical protein